MKEYIEKYFELLISNVNNHLRNYDPSDKEYEKLQIRLELINELEGSIVWQFQDPTDKQVSRIRRLATMRGLNFDELLIQKQEKAIYIYDQIKMTIPYLEAFNIPMLEDTVIKFVKQITENIDFSNNQFKKTFPRKEEVEHVFESYFKLVRIVKYDMFKECYEKIENLYEALLKIAED